MADREWYIDGQQIYETGTEEYYVGGVQHSENQAAAPAAADTSKNLLLIGVG